MDSIWDGIGQWLALKSLCTYPKNCWKRRKIHSFWSNCTKHQKTSIWNLAINLFLTEPLELSYLSAWKLNLKWNKTRNFLFFSSNLLESQHLNKSEFYLTFLVPLNGKAVLTANKLDSFDFFFWIFYLVT